MQKIVEYYSQLLLTFIGFGAPLLSILLPLFPEGINILQSKYENEKKQLDENIKNELEKKNEKGLDYQSLEKTLKTLKKNRKEAESKLSYLQPIKFTLRIFLPFIFAFAAAILTFYNFKFTYQIIILTISFILFIYGIYVIRNSILILVEVVQAVSESKKNYESKIVELLSTTAEKSGVDNIFLKQEKINVNFCDKLLKEKMEFTYSVNKKHEIALAILNTDSRMAKNVELGLTLPLDFLVEKTSNITSIYPGENNQIIRFNQDVIQSEENFSLDKIMVTFLKIGTFNIQAFVKGENIKTKRINFSIIIVN